MPSFVKFRLDVIVKRQFGEEFSNTFLESVQG